MSNKKFTTHQGKVMPLDIANVDTDAIIPKQFLRKINKIGFGAHLFHEWRFLDPDGKVPNPDFVFNKPQHQNCTILLARDNFGCGSSREHAPWAIADYGFRAMISSNFADIFYGNSLNNFILPIILSEQEVEQIFKLVNENPAIEMTIDLPQQQVTIADYNYSFELDPFKKHCLINGLDNIGMTLEFADEIAAYEAKIPNFLK